MNRRMWVLAVSAWVAVVIAGSALTWLAIDRAGQQVTGDGADATATEPAVVGTIGSAPLTTRTPRPKPSVTPSRTSSAAPTVSSSPTHAPPRSTASSPRTSSPQVRTETRTWSGAAGSVTVSCTGHTARFKGASPNDGWSVERGDTVGDSIEVKFEKNGTEVQVHASCVGGVPRFQTETSTGGADD